MKPILFHLISDYGHNATESVIVQAKLIKAFPDVAFVRGPQDFSKQNITHPALFLSLIIDDFPEHSLHIIDTFIPENAPEKFVLAQYKNQFVLAPDNGTLSVALPADETQYFRIPFSGSYPDVIKEVYLPFLIKWLTDEKGATTHLKPLSEIRKLQLPGPVLNGNRLVLTVIYNDSLGNAYFNIKKDEWEQWVAKRSFRLYISRANQISQISPGYSAVPEGQVLALFGQGNYLQIAQNRGNAREFLGLECDRQIFAEAEEFKGISI